MNSLQPVSFVQPHPSPSPLRRIAGRLRCLPLLLLAGLVLATPPTLAAPPASASGLDIATAVNLTGRQRMLSQRMTKAYLLLGQGIAADDAATLLKKSVEQFEQQLATLKTFQPTPKVRNAVAGLDSEWAKFKPLLAAPPAKADAIALYDANEALQKAAHGATLAYEEISSAPLDHLINLAGRQRMLSQRVAKFHLYRAWGINAEAADMEMHLSRAHFTAVLIQIQNSPLVTAKIREQAAKIQRDWEPYKQALLYSDPDIEKARGNAKRVAELSEAMLASTEELVASIEEESRLH